MKRFFLGLGAVLLAVFNVTVLIQPVEARSADNFTISSFEADYYLGKDDTGRSTLKTVETITAIFPSYNQNHGIERALPKQYNGHSTSLRVESVKDAEGNSLDYSDSTVNNNLVLRIGNADEYVHGTKHYIITYTQRDVTQFFSDTNADEFYWDVNGTRWAQGMGEVRARVHIEPSIVAQLRDRMTCYKGSEGSMSPCEITRADSDDVISANAVSVGPYENLTLAIGFAPHTFAAYQPSDTEKLISSLMSIWFVAVIIGSIGAVVAIILLSIRYSRIMKRAKGRGGILIAEYLPPKDVSVLLGAQVLGNSTSDITAQLIDLAVRHYLKIYQTKEKTLFKSAEYEIEIIKDSSDLSVEEQRLLKDLFGKSNVHIGARFAMKSLRSNYPMGRRLLKSRKQLETDARGKYKLFERAESDAGQFKKFGLIALIIGVLTLSPLVVIAGILAFVLASLLWPLTEKGAELRDYILGLREYITVAEKDRIKMLQSPEGAEKVGMRVDGKDSVYLVKLYERVLSYAVLLGIEKEWTKQLGVYYESSNSQPDWYSGNAAFNAVVFSTALGSFSSQSSSYSSSTSSSSGGSDGGGSSGGGGGGGGGGGW